MYAGAYFTIAASAYEDKGCFPVKFSEDHRVAIDVHPRLELNIYPRSSNFTYQTVGSEPLQKRGWTLQERLLSRRILYCSRYEYYWLCREQRLRACGGSDGWFEFFGAPQLLSNSAKSQRDALTQWYRLLKDYSSRQLTLKKDKRVAISGLADIFKRWIGPRYLHGLWERDLACGLAWRSFTSWRPKFSGSESGREVKTSESEKSQFWCTRSTRPPSWSWASVDGPQDHHGASLPGLDGNLRRSLSEFKLVHVKATVASDNEHSSCLGDKSSAEPELLKISGRLNKAFCGYKNADEQSDRIWHINSEGRAQAFLFYPDDPDFDTDEQDADAGSSRLYVLPLVADTGLVITPAGDDDVPLYRRVGVSIFLPHTSSTLKYNPDREQSEDSTPGTADSGTEPATVQTDDSVIQALGYANETDIEAADEGDDASSYTEGESSSTEDLTKSQGESDHVPKLDPYDEGLAECIRRLRKAGASETIFLC